MLNRLRRHLLLMLALLLPVQGMAGVLMLGCEHESMAAPAQVASHDSHHEHGAAKPKTHAGHEAQSGGLQCDDCNLCDLCASPGISSALAHAPLSPLSASPAGEAPRLASLAPDQIPRPPRFAGV
ncbi:MAG: hypothetical protein HYV16_05965 [Gammaproteobacteria bacterium]|nr:hypothetical protein [Gammaproteobacteria bacterium]